MPRSLVTAATVAAMALVGGCDGSDGSPAAARPNGEPEQSHVEITPAPGYEPMSDTVDVIGYTLDGAIGPDVPKLIVGPGHRWVDVDDRRTFAVERFGQLPPEPVPDTTTDVRIAGLPGLEMVGRGNDEKTVYGVVLFTDSGYILVAGDQPERYDPDQLPAFRTMARSLSIGAPSSADATAPTGRPERPERPTPTGGGGPPPPPTPPGPPTP
jgi:hypothetical protein